MTTSNLSDDALVASLHDICTTARRLDVRLIARLIEVEERRLHLKVACSSLFEFCVRRLKMSEGAAFRRINAARLMRRFPSLAAYIESGGVNLALLVLLRDHLSESNADELFAAAAGKTIREVELLLARLAPHPDVPSKARKLPASVPAPVPVPTPTPSGGNAAGPSGSLFERAVSSNAAPSDAAPIEPLSEARYKVQFTAGAGLREKLERAQDLMRHGNPSGDLAVVIEQAVDALVAKLEKERLAKTSHPRGTVDASPPSPQTPLTATASKTSSKKIESRALGGCDAANLRVTCRAHSLLHAEDVCGRKCALGRIHFRRRKSKLTRPTNEACEAIERSETANPPKLDVSNGSSTCRPTLWSRTAPPSLLRGT